MKRILSCFLAILMLASLAMGLVSPVFATSQETLYPYTIYEAEFAAEKFEEIFLHENTSFARTFLENLQEDKSFVATVTAWEAIHIATEPSYSLESGLITKRDLYRTVLFDLLNVKTSTGSVGYYFDEMLDGVTDDYADFVVSCTKDIMGAENISAAELKKLRLTSERKKLLLEGTSLGKTAALAADVEIILKLADSYYEAVELIAKYCAVLDLHDGTKEILTYIANDTSNAAELRLAAEDLLPCFEDSFQKVLSAVKQGTTGMLVDIIGDYCDFAWDAVVATIPGANVVFIAAKGMRALTNFFTSADDKVEAYYQIETSVACEDAMIRAFSAYRDQFLSDKTHRNAAVYTRGIKMYQSNVLLGFDYSVDLLEVIEGTNSAWISGLTDDVAELIAEIEDQKATKQDLYARFDALAEKSYKAEHFSDYDDVSTSIENAPAGVFVTTMSVSLNNDMAMNFIVEQDDLQSGESYYVILRRTYADGRDDEILRYDSSDWIPYTSGRYAVKYEGIAAKEMSDTIYVEVFHADGTSAGEAVEHSIKSYAMRFIDDTFQSFETRRVFVDMLNYGAAAQDMFGYGLNNLATSKLSYIDKLLASENVECTDHRVSGKNYYGTNLNLGNNIALNMFFKNINTDMYAIASFTDHYGNPREVRIDGSEFTVYNKTRGIYRVPIHALALADMKQMVTCTVYNTDGTVAASARDSVESYVARMADRDDLYQMIMRFASSAYTFFHGSGAM